MFKTVKKIVYDDLPVEYDETTGTLTKGQARFLGFVIVLMAIGVAALYIFG